MSQVAEALEKAGYRSPKKQFETIVLKAIIASPGSPTKAERAVWCAVRSSLPLLLELIGQRWEGLVESAVSDCRKQLGTGEVRFFGRNLRSTSPFFTQSDFLPVKNALQREAQMVSGAWRDADKLAIKQGLEVEEAYQDKQQKQANAELLTWLDTQASKVKVNGRPFWQVSANEAERAANQATQEAAFLFMAIEGVPRDGSPIGNFLRPQEVDALWARAKNAV